MPILIVNPTAAAAWAAATSKTGQLTALITAFGGPITARLEGSGGTLRRTITLPAPTISTPEDPRIVLGAHLTDTPASTGDIGRWVLRNSSGVDILTVDADDAAGAATVDHAGPVKTLCTPTLAGVTILPSAGLPPVGVAAWIDGQPTGQWIDIPGTANPPGGLQMNAYCDMTLRPSDSTILVVAAGGHNDSSSNAAAALALNVDSPAWTLLRASSWNGSEADVTRYADGTPASRHTYHHTHYIASRNAVLLAGCRFGWGPNTPTGPAMDLFDLDTNTYNAAGTWPNLPILGDYGVAQDGDGNIWTSSGRKFTVATATWSKPGSGQLHRYPAAYSPSRNRIFALQYGNGEGEGSEFGLIALELDPTTGNSVGITFNASAARAQLIADTPDYAGMAFCPVDGKFYFLHPGRIGTFYVITPNAGTVWDVATYTPTGTAPPAVGGSGSLCKRLLWVPALSGFVVQSNQASNMKFLKVA